MLHRLGLVVICVLVAFAACGTLAQERWGSTGHQHITAGAIAHLPQPLRWFFQNNSATVVTQSGVEPPGTHYIDIDAYADFFAGTFPHDETVAFDRYGVGVVTNNGTGPWLLGMYSNMLTTYISTARTPADWVNVLTSAGMVAHYAEDLHNPLHMTKNYDGQESGNDGIHSRYESRMISRHLGDLPITPAPDQCVYYPSIVDAIFDRIDVNYWYVDDILAADTHATSVDPTRHDAYYATLWTDTGPFTQLLFQQASEFLAGVWYTAWVNAGSPAPIPSGPVGDLNCDGTVGFRDINPFVMYLSDFSAWQALFPGCPAALGDINGDGTYPSFHDINAFVVLITGTS